jgi:2-succinyl-5-enolpyruvyl-6-hydroxy-3-cyclohexene-1-carboxylate synthase
VLPGSVRWIAGRRVVVEGAGTILANRGLAGIDGTVSTARGVAAVTPGRTRLLLGDLTLLHDAGGLLTGTHEQVPQLQIVVVDDAGGGIFGLLEQGARGAAGAAEKAVFERLFATPQGADLAVLCQAYGVTHTLAGDLAALRAALADPPSGLSLVQVPVSRDRERALADRIGAAVRTGLS